MQIQILSDLHLEIERLTFSPEEESYTYDFPVKAEMLALLGDIGCTVHEQLFEWLKVQLKRFTHVFFVMGNHEPYGSSIDKATHRLRDFGSQVFQDPTIHGHFIFLNRTRFDLSPTLTILGCTLWSLLDPSHKDILTSSLKDFQRIENFSIDAFVKLHQEDVNWLNEMVLKIAKEEPERKIMILTHHAPTIHGTSHPKLYGHPTNSAFATELLEEGEYSWKTSGNVEVWAFGHTHWCCEFDRGGIRVFSNQRGNGEGKEGFDNVRTLVLGGEEI